MKLNVIFYSCRFLTFAAVSIMFIFKQKDYFIDFIVIKTIKEKKAETKTGFSNIIVVESTSDKLCPTKYKHCSNTNAGGTIPEPATKLPAGSATMYPGGSGSAVSSAEFFPARNGSDLTLRLSAALDLLEPFLCRLDVERSWALESISGRAWRLDTTRSRTFLRASDANYFQVIGRIASVRTLVLKPPISAVRWVLGGHVFPWTGSDCQLIDDTLFYQNHQPGHLYNYTCQSNISKTLKPRLIDKNLLHDPVVPPGVGRNSSSAVLTYLHTATNGLVNKIGHVLLSDAKIEQKSCPIDAQASGNSDTRTMEEYPLYKELFVASQFWNGYFHMIIEQMSRLAPFICFLRKHPTIRIHMNIADEMMDVVGKYFDLLNIDSTRIIRGKVRAEVIYLPAGTPCTNPSLFNIRLLSLWLRHSIRTVPDSRQAIPDNTELLRSSRGPVTGSKRVIPGSRRTISHPSRLKPGSTRIVPHFRNTIVDPRNSVVLIKRQKGRRRRWFDHHEEIKKQLLTITTWNNTNLFTLEEFTDPVPPLGEVGRMFSRASVIVAPHGAGLSNMLFSEPGTVIVEGMCRVAFTALSFRNLAHLLGHRYYGVFTRKSCVDVTPDDLLEPVTFYLSLAGDHRPNRSTPAPSMVPPVHLEHG